MGISISRIGDDFIEGLMSVDHRTRQNMGLLHGGASVLFAETLGSVAANYCVDFSTHYCVGLDINANHVRRVEQGVVIGVARALHIGRSTQVWEIKICDNKNRLVSIARLTMAVVCRRESEE